ncbi:hypothetical protein H8E77_27350 [bacterium]|nr:hypothetical protein [bacterium]
MKKLIILIFAFIGWMLCGGIMWIGMAVTSVETTFIIHLIGAPIVFGILAFVYHWKFGHIRLLYATIIFTGFVIGDHYKPGAKLKLVWKNDRFIEPIRCLSFGSKLPRMWFKILV